MNGLTREEWEKLKEFEEPEPERVCLSCNQPLEKRSIAYPADPGEHGVLCSSCWRKRLFTSSGKHALHQQQTNPC
jgi:hypothetical protein